MPLSDSAPPGPASPVTQRLLAVLVVLAAVLALKAAKPVAMPLAFALFFVILFRPVYRGLSGPLPRGIALFVTFLAALAVLGLFGFAVGFAIDEAIEGMDRYRNEWANLREQARALLGRVSPGEGSGPSSERLAAMLERVASGVWSVIAYLVLILALFVLALGEVDRWKHKLRRRFDDPVSTDAVETAEAVTKQVQRFLVVQSLTSVVTGVLTGMLCWAIGVDFPLLWGLLALVLNFIPTLGSIVAIVPPTLFALLQFGLGWQAPVVLLGLAAIQLVLGAYVDPRLQGRYLRLSAFVVLVAITFWSWVWGIPGAFIATPLTAALVLVFEHHEGTAWVARLLTRDEPS